jgi:Integrase zinc binding domain
MTYPITAFSKMRNSLLMILRYRSVVDSEGLARYQSQAVWIPDSNKTLQQQLLIAAHTGPGGHRRITTTEQVINGFGHWASMRKDLASFVNTCIHYSSTLTGGTVPRPMALTLHANKPKKLLHVDFLTSDMDLRERTTFSLSKTISHRTVVSYLRLRGAL